MADQTIDPATDFIDPNDWERIDGVYVPRLRGTLAHAATVANVVRALDDKAKPLDMFAIQSWSLNRTPEEGDYLTPDVIVSRTDKPWAKNEYALPHCVFLTVEVLMTEENFVTAEKRARLLFQWGAGDVFWAIDPVGRAAFTVERSNLYEGRMFFGGQGLLEAGELRIELVDVLFDPGSNT